MARNVDIDISDFIKKAKDFSKEMERAVKQGTSDIAHEVLRLSSFEVPHDTGMLQSSGVILPNQPEYEMTVGYNKVYAARLHEHPEYNFGKGRKGKYLEDPMKNNNDVFIKYMGETIKSIMRM